VFAHFEKCVQQIGNEHENDKNQSLHGVNFVNFARSIPLARPRALPNSRPIMTITPEALIAAAHTSKAWPFQEAQRLAKRLPEGKPGGVLFETGYGPSGLPHIGTFQEVLRTTLVRRAYEALTGGAATRRLCWACWPAWRAVPRALRRMWARAP
jgi:hypothetical protein